MTRRRLPGRFARALSRLRARAGFPTAYKFYHHNGGRRAFPFTYSYYAKLERGEGLPRAAWLRTIMTLLRLPLDAGDRRELLVAYLVDVLGGEETYSELFAPLLRPPEKPPFEAQAVGRLIKRNAYHLTPDQFRAALASPAAYWSFICFQSRRQGSTVRGIGEACGLPDREVAAALSGLAAHKLASRSAAEVYRCPHADRYAVLPRNYAGYDGHVRWLESYWREMTERRGAELFDLGAVFRAPATVALAAAERFRRTIEAASAAADEEEGGEAAAVYLLRARASKLLTF